MTMTRESTLCLDFGNTRLKWACFREGRPAERGVLGEATEAEIASVLDACAPGRSILSSVIAHPPEIEQALAARTAFHKLGETSKLPFATPVGKRDTMGADRLALLAAAATLHPGRHSLVIGLGSAVTYNFLNKYGEFLGGGISPGLAMRFRSLQAFTAKLPLVEAHWNFPLLGYDTKTNIQSGVITGMTCEIDGTIAAYKEKYERLAVAMTGGDAEYFSRRLAEPVDSDPDMLFNGLYAISEINR